MGSIWVSPPSAGDTRGEGIFGTILIGNNLVKSVQILHIIQEETRFPIAALIPDLMHLAKDLLSSGVQQIVPSTHCTEYRLIKEECDTCRRLEISLFLQIILASMQ